MGGIIMALKIGSQPKGHKRKVSTYIPEGKICWLWEVTDNSGISSQRESPTVKQT